MQPHDSPRMTSPFSAYVLARPGCKRRDVRALMALATVVTVIFPQSLWAVPVQDNRYAERPSGQYGVDSTTSYMKRSFFYSLGNGQISFRYYVDSEWNYDFLNFYIDGVKQDLNPYIAGTQGISGLNKRGYFSSDVSTGVTHIFKWEYYKDGSVSSGLDTAWVDDVRFTNSSISVSVSEVSFDTTDTLASLGWTAGGYAGGWTIGAVRRSLSLGRPGAQYGVNDGSASYAERWLTWPACNPACPKWQGAVSFDYFVDSEASWDFLNVYIDGVKQDLDPLRAGTQGISGPNKYGSLTLPTTSSGTHTVRFEYYKDYSISLYRDTAKVDHVRFISGNGTTMEYHDFTGRDLLTTPIRATVNGYAGPAEWVSGGTGGGWVVNRITPPIYYVPKQIVGTALSVEPKYKIFQDPLLDGIVKDSKEYKNTTRVDLFNVANPGAEPGRFGMVNSNNTLVIAMRAKARTLDQGNEFGNFYMYFDANRPLTLRDTGDGCPTGVQFASANDRYIACSYSIAVGGVNASVACVEYKGNCLGGWTSLSGAAAWLTGVASQIKVSEPINDAGFDHFEIKIPLPAGVVADGQLGFGFRRVSSQYTLSEERFPSDAMGGPLLNDAYTWATLNIGTVPVNSRDFQSSENFTRLIGHPWPERPRRFFRQ